MKNNKKKLAVLAALFLAFFSIGGAIAYLTDTEAPIKNTFTFGKVDIELTEPSWEGGNTNTVEVMPGAVVSKDPTVTVKEGSKPAYIFIQATKNGSDLEFTPKSGWVLVSGTTDVYAYGTQTEMTKVSEKQSATLFDQVTVKTTATGDVQTQDITVSAYAIQADNIEGKTPAQVWALIK